MARKPTPITRETVIANLVRGGCNPAESELLVTDAVIDFITRCYDGVTVREAATIAQTVGYDINRDNRAAQDFAIMPNTYR